MSGKHVAKQSQPWTASHTAGFVDRHLLFNRGRLPVDLDAYIIGHDRHRIPASARL
jgi:hypothetical protein